jgi:hypothetical protein
MLDNGFVNGLAMVLIFWSDSFILSLKVTFFFFNTDFNLKNPDSFLEDRRMTEILPDELWLMIFKHISPHQICVLKQVCKTFEIIANDETLWQQKLDDFYRPMFPQKSTAQKKFLVRHKSLRWSEARSEVLQDYLSSLIKTYRRFSCQEPPVEIVFHLIFKRNGDVDEDFMDTLSEDNCISEPLENDFFHTLSLSAIVFFAENFPQIIAPFLFGKWGPLKNNDLLTVLIWASASRRLSLAKLAKRAVCAVLENFSRAQVLNHIINPHFYTFTTNDESETYTSSCFRRLIYEGCHEAIDMIVAFFGSAEFVPEIQRVDEINFTVLNELTAEAPTRGVIDLKTLDVLYKHFEEPLHALVQQHLFLPETPNPICSISDSTNTDYIRHFFHYFRAEGQQFVSWCETDPSQPLIAVKDHGFQKVYAFAKTWSS